MKLWLKTDDVSKVRIKCPVSSLCRGLDEKQTFDTIFRYYSIYFERLDQMHLAMVGELEYEQRYSSWYKFDLESIGKYEYLLILKKKRESGKSWGVVEQIAPFFMMFLDRA